MRPPLEGRYWSRIWAPAKPRSRWPVFAAAAMQAGAGAIFAFPLQIGAIRAGCWACTGRGQAR